MKKEKGKAAAKHAGKKKNFAARVFSAMSGKAKGCLMAFMMAASGLFVVSLVSDVTLFFQLKAENVSSSALLEETLEKKEELETTKKNLTNPDYLEYVARGRYYVSRSDEQVFVFPNIDSSASAD